MCQRHRFGCLLMQEGRVMRHKTLCHVGHEIVLYALSISHFFEVESGQR